jgi:hypothetical protein
MRCLLIAPACLILACRPQPRPVPTSSVTTAAAVRLVEASGLTRDRDSLVLVGDESPEAYYTYGLRPSDYPSGAGPILSFFAVDPSRLTAHRLFTPLALDLEGVALLEAGTPLMISETMRSLLTPDRLVAMYPRRLSELGNRGIEGVAVRIVSDTVAQVVVLWEGGFLERSSVLKQFDAFPGLLDTPLNPVICIHSLPLPISRMPEAVEPCRSGTDLIELQVPTPPDTLQRFRAPDLVWLPSGEGFLVLLSSQNATTAPKIEYKYKWLQRFDRSGAAVGSPLNLCAILPAAMKAGRSGNIEGISWFEEGKSVLLVNDFGESASVVIVAVGESWSQSASENCA